MAEDADLKLALALSLMQDVVQEAAVQGVVPDEQLAQAIRESHQTQQTAALESEYKKSFSQWLEVKRQHGARTLDVSQWELQQNLLEMLCETLPCFDWIEDLKIATATLDDSETAFLLCSIPRATLRRFAFGTLNCKPLRQTAQALSALLQETHLVELELVGQQLLRCLPGMHFKSLTKLSITSSLTEVSLAFLASAVCDSSIEDFSLAAETPQQDDGICLALASVVRNLASSVKSLSFAFLVDIPGPDGRNELGKALGDCPLLTKFSFTGRCYPRADILALLVPLLRAGQLEELFLCSKSIRPAELFLHFPLRMQLRKLFLSQVASVTERDLDAALSLCSEHVTHFMMETFNPDEEDESAFSPQVLKKLRSLEKLEHLSIMVCRREAGKDLAVELKGHPTLKHLGTTFSNAENFAVLSQYPALESLYFVVNDSPEDDQFVDSFRTIPACHYTFVGRDEEPNQRFFAKAFSHCKSVSFPCGEPVNEFLAELVPADGSNRNLQHLELLTVPFEFDDRLAFELAHLDVDVQIGPIMSMFGLQRANLPSTLLSLLRFQSWRPSAITLSEGYVSGSSSDDDANGEEDYHSVSWIHILKRYRLRGIYASSAQKRSVAKKLLKRAMNAAALRELARICLIHIPQRDVRKYLLQTAWRVWQEVGN